MSSVRTPRNLVTTPSQPPHYLVHRSPANLQRFTNQRQRYGSVVSLSPISSQSLSMSGGTESSTAKRSWAARYIPRPSSSGGRPKSSSSLPTPTGRPSSSNGFKVKEIVIPFLAGPHENKKFSNSSPITSLPSSAVHATSTSATIIDTHAAIPTSSTSSSVPTPATHKRWSTLPLLTSSLKPSSQDLDRRSDNALERSVSAQTPSTGGNKQTDMNKTSSGFGKMSFSSMMGGLSSLSLSRTSTNTSVNVAPADDKESRGRSMLQLKRVKSASQAPPDNDNSSRSLSRARSQSPFSFRRFRTREASPTPQPLPLGNSDIDLPTSSHVRPRTAFTDDPDSGDETVGETDAETEDDDWSDDDLFDPVTERNTERNALIAPVPAEVGLGADDVEPDPLGEGVNVVVPPEPYFPSSLNYSGSGSTGSVRGKRQHPRRKKSVKHHEPLPLQTSRPIFQRDRCTITITQGDPPSKLDGRRQRRYVVASDLSEESRYAVEWGIGTVLRDGDEMLILTVVENEAKVDPAIPNTADRTTKLRSQQERQGLAYILVRQATSILQRTKLNVTVACQAWHAKNARHMLLDIVDHNEPTMLIVGSRGLGQLKGILLGSTSHYLIQKCSVPVMVARRRLKRPPRRSAHLSTHRVHVSLAEAGIDRVAPRVDQDVKVMRDEIQRDDNRRDGGPGSRNLPGIRDAREVDDDADDDDDGDEIKEEERV